MCGCDTGMSPAGRLATALGGQSLISSKIIIDSQWHEVGLTWDGSSRKLSVDGADVAKDKPDGCGNSAGGLNFAVGKNLDTGTYWSGLIDGVRIYGRAAKSAGK